MHRFYPVVKKKRTLIHEFMNHRTGLSILAHTARRSLAEGDTKMVLWLKSGLEGLERVVHLLW